LGYNRGGYGISRPESRLMGDPDKAAAKQARKLAKAAQKAEKWRLPAGSTQDGPGHAAAQSESDTTRLAERKLSLERWRTIFTAIGTLIALVSLLVAYLVSRSRA
jgi:hypothetical protein